MKIGWAMVDVTPDMPTALRGQHHTRIAEYASDPVTATVLAIEGDDGRGGTAQAVMVSCDRVSVSGVIQDRLREALASRLPDLDTAMLVLNATHTHSAPTIREGLYPPQGPEVMTPTAYGDLFVERVTDAIVEAWNAREPGAVSWAYGHAVVGHNRRASYLDGHSQMYGATDGADFAGLEGYEDHGVDLMFTWTPSGKITGIIVNLACPSQVTESTTWITADYWHETRLQLHELLGEDVFVLAQCSAAGDQSPHLLIHKQAEARMLEARGLTEREEVGRRITAAVADVLDTPAATARVSDPVLRHEVVKADLPMRMVTDEEHREAEEQLAAYEAQTPDPSDSAATSRRFIMMRRNRAVIGRYEKQRTDPFFPVELHCVRIGDIAFATNPFELFLDFGLRIKARSQAVQTFVVQLASGGGKTDGTYLPTERAVAARSYGAEAADNIVGPEGGQVIVERSLEAISTMWDET